MTELRRFVHAYAEMLAAPVAACGGRLGDGAGDVCLWSAWPTPDLRARGWELEGFPPYLLRLPGGPLPPDAPDLSVRPVTDAVALADWERVVVEGYPFGAT